MFNNNRVIPPPSLHGATPARYIFIFFHRRSQVLYPMSRLPPRQKFSSYKLLNRFSSFSSPFANRESAGFKFAFMPPAIYIYIYKHSLSLCYVGHSARRDKSSYFKPFVAMRTLYPFRLFFFLRCVCKQLI